MTSALEKDYFNRLIVAYNRIPAIGARIPENTSFHHVERDALALIAARAIYLESHPQAKTAFPRSKEALPIEIILLCQMHDKSKAIHNLTERINTLVKEGIFAVQNNKILKPPAKGRILAPPVELLPSWYQENFNFERKLNNTWIANFTPIE